MKILKDFSDFTKMLNTETVKEIISSANDYAEKVQTLNINKSSIIGAEVTMMSFKMSLALLEKYHEWLAL